MSERVEIRNRGVLASVGHQRSDDLAPILRLPVAAAPRHRHWSRADAREAAGAVWRDLRAMVDMDDEQLAEALNEALGVGHIRSGRVQAWRRTAPPFDYVPGPRLAGRAAGAQRLE